MRKVFRLSIVMILIGLLVGCANNLNREAQGIMTIKDGGVIALMNCKELGFVTGDSGVWGGYSGMSQAMVDAKNKAAKMLGANAILVTNSRMNPTSFVNAKVFNCSETKPQKIEVVNHQPPQPASKQEQDLDLIIQKAKKCQSKGGAWLDNRCVISIQ